MFIVLQMQQIKVVRVEVEASQALADSIKDALNIFLEDKEGFGGVEGIHFTSFVLQ